MLRLGSAGALAQAKLPEQECARCGRLVCAVLPRAVRPAAAAVSKPPVGGGTAALLCRRSSGSAGAAPSPALSATVRAFPTVEPTAAAAAAAAVCSATQCGADCSGTSRAWAGTPGRSTPCLPTKTSCDPRAHYCARSRSHYAVTTQSQRRSRGANGELTRSIERAMNASALYSAACRCRRPIALQCSTAERR